jgi:hypothetical protein
VIGLNNQGGSEPLYVDPSKIICVQRGVHVGLPEDKLWTDVWFDDGGSPTRVMETPEQISRLRLAWINRETPDARFPGTAIVAIRMEGDSIVGTYANIEIDRGH